VDIIKSIINKAKGLNVKIIFPEGEDDRILKAVEYAVKNKIVKPILIGDETIIRRKSKIKATIIQPDTRYAKLYSKKTKTGKKTAELIVQKPLFYAACAVAAGDAQAMVAGAVYTSGDVIAVSTNVIGMQRGISVPSSYFIMSVPGWQPLIYADASVNPNPGPQELADIAIASGDSGKKLLGWTPKVAMLSFSTKGSAEHPDVCKVIKATELAKKKSNYNIDGELQADSALIMSTAKKKIKGKLGSVAGRANTLIFPDLDAGNIAYKLTQRLANAAAYGPILQGFSKPVSDLSRGATVEDIVGVIAIIAVISSRWKK